MFPHGVHDTSLALTEARHLWAENGVEVKCTFMRIFEKFGSVVQADVPDKDKELVEGIAGLISEVLASRKKGMSTQKKRNRQTELVKSSEGRLERLGIFRTKLIRNQWVLSCQG